MKDIQLDYIYNFGSLKIRLNELIEENKVSKNKVCKELDIPRSIFNKYCRNEFQRLDANLLCKLCYYFEIEISELIEYQPPEKEH